MRITTSPSHGDTRKVRWWKIVLCLQALPGANSAYDPIGTEPVRRLMWKAGKSLGADVTTHMAETRLMRKILDRLNELSATEKPDARFPFYGSGATMRWRDALAATEEKILASLNRVAAFSEDGAPAVDGTAGLNTDSLLVLTRKVLKRLNQIIGAEYYEVIGGEDSGTYRVGEDGESITIGEH